MLIQILPIKSGLTCEYMNLCTKSKFNSNVDDNILIISLLSCSLDAQNSSLTKSFDMLLGSSVFFSIHP